MTTSNANGDPKVEAFLAEVEGLTHNARQRRMVDLGQAAAKGDEAAKALLRGLVASNSAYARALAVTSIFGSKDSELALTMIADRSRLVRSRAARVIVHVGTDEQCAKALARCVTTKARTKLAIALRRKKRLAPIDAFFATVSGSLADDRTLCATLPIASGSAVDASLQVFEELANEIGWSRLAKLHTAHFTAYVMKALAQDQASASGAIDFRLQYRIGRVAGVYAHSDPTAALGVMRFLLEGSAGGANNQVSHAGDPNSPIVRAMLPHVLRRHPREVFDLLRRRHESAAPALPPGAFGAVRFDPVAHRLGADRLRYLIEHAWATLSDFKKGRAWFFRLSAEDRAAVVETFTSRGRGGWGGFLLRHVPAGEAREAAYARWSTQAQSSEGIIPLHVALWLPADLRHREARRHLALPVLSTRVDVRNTYASLLPFDEAKKALDPFLGHPEGEERAKAIRALLCSVTHEPTSMGAALELVRSKKFEQDPVRLAMLTALSWLPVARFELKHLDDVGTIVSDALDAADLSYGTAASAERLVVRLFRVDAMWGAKWLTTILQRRGSLIGAVGPGVGLVDLLTPRDVDRLAPALVELASTWATQERCGALLWLARSLGIRLAKVPALLDALERMTREQPFVGVAALALGLLSKHARKRFTALVPELIAVDPSYIIVTDVATLLSCHRQDLLAPFVSDAPMTGRFATGRTSWAIRFQRGHDRWTPRLQTLHAEAWKRILQDEKRDVPSLINAVNALAELAFAPPEGLLDAAADKRQAVRETGVRALPWLDEGQGAPTLLACLGDDRARWAIYALRKAFSEMPRAEVLEHLRHAPINKVTVAKEVIRLLGELGGKEAYDILLQHDTNPDLHRDIRIALLRALWDYLERDETWAVFDRAVTHKDWVVASKLADIPLGSLSEVAQERLVGLLVRILGRPEPEARLALLARTPSLAVSDRKRVLFRALVDHLGSQRPDEALAAARAVIVRMAPGEGEAVLGRLRELSHRRDLMVELIPAFAPSPYSPEHVRQLAESLVTMLARDPLATVHYVRFAGSVFDWKRLVAVFEDLGRRDFMHSDAMMAAYETIARCVHPALIEQTLAKHKNPRLRRLAVEALKHAAGPQNGWTPERRAKLEAYRRDEAPLVAGAAVYIFPPHEEARPTT